MGLPYLIFLKNAMMPMLVIAYCDHVLALGVTIPGF